MYYLNSRYYNPEWCRFINADSIIGGNVDILGTNLYTYASNNPVMNTDTQGNKIGKWLKKATNTVVAVIHTIKKGISNFIKSGTTALKQQYISLNLILLSLS